MPSDAWQLRTVPAALGERYVAEGWWTDDGLGDMVAAGLDFDARRGVQRALEGPSVARHVRRCGPSGPLAGRHAPGEGCRAGRRRRLPAPELGGGRHHVLGGELPRCGRRAHRALLRRQGGRVHPAHDVARRRRHGGSVRPLRLPGHLRVAARRSARLRCGWWSARRPSATCLPGRRRSRRCSTATPWRPRQRSIRTHRRSSGSPPARPATRRASSTRTARSASRPVSSTTCSRRAGRRQITGSPVGHFIGMLNAFLVPLLRERPVNLIDVWDPAEVLRMMLEEDLGARRWRHLLPHEPARPSRLHRRAPGPDALRRARRLHRPGRGHGAGRRRSASRASARTAAPSTRRSPACLLDDPERQAAHDRRSAAAGGRDPPRRRRRDLQPGTGLLHRLHRPRVDGRPPSRTTGGTGPATSACSTRTGT